MAVATAAGVAAVVVTSVAAVVAVARLARHRALVPTIAEWFRQVSPGWYAPGGAGDAVADLCAFAAGTGQLPGVVAFVDGEPCGAAASKASSIPSHAHLGPWAAAGCARPAGGGQGSAAHRLAALDGEARVLGHAALYCGTATAGSRLQRAGWFDFDEVELGGKAVGVHRKTLSAPPARA